MSINNITSIPLVQSIAGTVIPQPLLTAINRELLDPHGNQLTPAIQQQIQNRSSNTGADQFSPVPRIPFALTCQSWLQQNRFILCAANPSSIEWSFKLRGSKQKTMAGEVIHRWRNLSGRRVSYFNEPEVRFNFQSGNLMPVVFNQEGPADPRPTAPRGLRNFYEFIELMGQPAILNDESGSRRSNVIYITYNSVLFPQMVLTGVFDPEGFQITDNSEDPNRITWTSPFTVYATYPNFESPTELMNAFVSAGFGRIR